MSRTSTCSPAKVLALFACLLFGGGCGGGSNGADEPVLEPCSPGRARSASTDGHCCWPGQSWDEVGCVGTPLCPEGLVATSLSCECAPGRVLQTGGQCCYPGQSWSDAAGACVGTPSACATGEVVAGDACIPGGWVSIPGGIFTMGTDDGAAVEGPAHKVRLSPYEIQRTEVTVRQYAECVAAGACEAAPRVVAWRGITNDQKELYSRLCNAGREGREDHPINCVDWELAGAYCAWAGGALPTEAQWEFAARGADERVFPWGADAPTPDRLNACDEGCVSLAAELGREWSPLFSGNDGHADTAPVASYPAGVSAFGLFDAAGNVWEWVGDWAGRYGRGNETDPTGPTRGRGERITRGGAWDDDSVDLVRATSRDAGRTDLRDVNVGFRCARPAQGEAATPAE